jgi:hypothetical protein
MIRSVIASLGAGADVDTFPAAGAAVSFTTGSVALGWHAEATTAAVVAAASRMKLLRPIPFFMSVSSYWGTITTHVRTIVRGATGFPAD